MSTSTNTSFGFTVGSALGKGAAYALHGVALAAQSTGQFGKDVAASASVAYAEKSAELAEQRKQALAKALAMREAGLLPAATEVVPAKPVARQRKIATAKA